MFTEQRYGLTEQRGRCGCPAPIEIRPECDAIRDATMSALGGLLEKIGQPIIQAKRHRIVRGYIDDLRETSAALQKMNANIDLTAVNLAVKALRIILSKAVLGEEDM